VDEHDGAAALKLGEKCTPGVLIDGTATSIPASSRYAIAPSRLQRGGLMPPAAFPSSFEASQ
jgi:hypothetical protein